MHFSSGCRFDLSVQPQSNCKPFLDDPLRGEIHLPLLLFQKSDASPLWFFFFSLDSLFFSHDLDFPHLNSVIDLLGLWVGTLKGEAIAARFIEFYDRPVDPWHNWCLCEDGCSLPALTLQRSG